MADHKTHVIQEFYCKKCFEAAQYGYFGEGALAHKIVKEFGQDNKSAAKFLHYHVRDLTSTGRAMTHEKYRKPEPAFKRAGELMMQYANGHRSTHIQVDPCVGASWHCRGIREE